MDSVDTTYGIATKIAHALGMGTTGEPFSHQDIINFAKAKTDRVAELGRENEIVTAQLKNAADDVRHWCGLYGRLVATARRLLGAPPDMAPSERNVLAAITETVAERDNLRERLANCLDLVGLQKPAAVLLHEVADLIRNRTGRWLVKAVVEADHCETVTMQATPTGLATMTDEPETFNTAWGSVEAADHSVPTDDDSHGVEIQSNRQVAARGHFVAVTDSVPTGNGLHTVAVQPGQVVRGVGKDAPTATNAAGGKQSASPYRVDLLPPLATLAVAGVLAYGAAKYGPNNWHKIPVADHLNHMLVHAFAWLAGDKQDDHLEHMACRAFMALERYLMDNQESNNGKAVAA